MTLAKNALALSQNALSSGAPFRDALVTMRRTHEGAMNGHDLRQRWPAPALFSD